VRRSQRSGSVARVSTGALLRGAGFMYAPNDALAPRLMPAAGRAAAALGAPASPRAVRGRGALLVLAWRAHPLPSAQVSSAT